MLYNINRGNWLLAVFGEGWWFTHLEECDGKVHRIHGVHSSSTRGTVGKGEDNILPEQSLVRRGAEMDERKGEMEKRP